MSQPETFGVLFVCLGNICRSPTAEGVFRHLVRERGLEAAFRIDSAGTSGLHAGDRSDARTLAAARRRGLRWDHRARQVAVSDFEEFELLVAMDRRNEADLRSLAPQGSAAEILLLRSLDPAATLARALDVPDPYYGGDAGFEEVLDLCERCCSALLDRLVDERGLSASRSPRADRGT